MQCPLCIDESLQAYVRNNVEVDLCPRCRGIWLDRDEINRIANDDADLRRPRRSKSKPSSEDWSKENDESKSKDGRSKEDRRKRRKNFVERLVDTLEDIVD